MSNNWYVITGGPSTGKTTLLEELEKLGHKTVAEAARSVIDEALKKGISIEQLRTDEKQFQHDVVKLKAEIEALNDQTALTFFDRGMHDTIAYLRYYGFTIEDWVLELMRNAKYKKVFLLEPLSTYKQDYARTEDHDFTKGLQAFLKRAYTEYGMEPVSVPALSVNQRVQFILDEAKDKQTV